MLAILFVAIQPYTATSQTVGTLQPGFGQAIVVLHQAESAGATSSEVGQAVVLLNTALELNRQALKLNTPEEAERQAALLAQVDQILATVEKQAGELTLLAYRRMYTNKVVAYVWGAIAAVLGTIIIAFAMSFHHKNRIKRTFQMRVSRK